MRLKIMKIYKLLEVPKGSHVRSNKAAGYYETVHESGVDSNHVK